MNEKIAFENLKDTIEVLDNLKIKWWLEAGTCLGAFREKNFIAHDTDIDFGVFGFENKDDLIIEMVKRGFDFHYIYGSKSNGYELSFIRNGIKVDIFYFYKSKDISYTSIWKGKEQIILDFPSSFFENLFDYEFLGLDVKLPNPPEKYLTLRYGNWQEVVKNWDWAYGAKNIRNKNK